MVLVPACVGARLAPGCTPRKAQASSGSGGWGLGVTVYGRRGEGWCVCCGEAGCWCEGSSGRVGCSGVVRWKAWCCESSGWDVCFADEYHEGSGSYGCVHLQLGY